LPRGGFYEQNPEERTWKQFRHSVIPRETNSNFGFNLPWWDRLRGTYRPQPEAGHGAMTIGLKEFRDPARLTLIRLLIQPFVR